MGVSCGRSHDKGYSILGVYIGFPLFKKTPKYLAQKTRRSTPESPPSYFPWVNTTSDSNLHPSLGGS